ncbi:hypothetical protein Glove_508g64 [Diversispora epigaea]|uniref:Uncharacterized protein n=1 Tax=Diversispora epigaea TaxID=1348612 RepID=A0A397GHK7_9GLOM|nr:hypothetical protein Glove_508g64 [Diversispora epigaea]
MNSSRVNHNNIFFFVLMVTLVLIVNCIVLSKASSENELNTAQKNDNFGSNNNDSTNKNNDNDTNSEENPFKPIIIIFTILWNIVMMIYWIITMIFTPFIWISKILFNAFIYNPYMAVKAVLYFFSPLFIFCSVALALGICVGGTAGWFSEVIVGVLTAPNNIEIMPSGIENNKRMAKLKRRAAALANLKARNGGRIPEEYYRHNMLPKRDGSMEEYGNDYNNNKEFLAAGVGE